MHRVKTRYYAIGNEVPGTLPSLVAVVVVVMMEEKRSLVGWLLYSVCCTAGNGGEAEGPFITATVTRPIPMPTTMDRPTSLFMEEGR